VSGTSFIGRDRAALGNWSYNYPITVASNYSASLAVADFYNISAIDNYTTYGDNRATIEIGDTNIGYSIDEIVYTYISHFTITRMNPLIVAQTGDSVTLTGTGFISSPGLNCKFGTVTATKVTFLNSSTIICGTPIVTDTSLNYSVSLTINGYEYNYAINPTTSIPYALVFQS
jgi:hypothetical protein